MIRRNVGMLLLLVCLSVCTDANAITVLRSIPGIDRLPQQDSGTADNSLTDDPVLRIETGAHSARILSTAADTTGTWLVTAAADKSVRVWEISSGRLLRVLRPPAGDGIVGDIYRAAITPNGAIVAVGWQSASRAAIFLFDRATGIVILRIDGLADVVTDLQFSPNGKLLAASVVRGGVQLFDVASGREIGRDLAYGRDSYSVDFSPDGRRLLTTSLDGMLRLYSVEGTLRKLGEATGTRLKSLPLNARFSPDGQWIAVGYDHAGGISIFRAADLSNTGPINDIFVWSNIPHFAWSRDGRFIDGLGSDSHGHLLIRRWSEHEAVHPGGPTFNMLSSHIDVSLPGAPIIANPMPLPDGGLIIANESPGWGVLGRDGSVDWREQAAESRHANYIANAAGGPTLPMSADGTQVGFRYKYGDDGGTISVFDVNRREIGGDAKALTPARQSAPSLRISSRVPSLNGVPVPLAPNEFVTSYAVTATGDRLVVGTTLALNIYDGSAKLLSRVTSYTDAVGISSNGRWIVADLADGTIRWYRAEDGKEALALYPHPDRKRWVLWTPSGYYASSVAGDRLIGWQINHGAKQAADFFPISRFHKEFYRPDVIAKVLATGDEREALRIANQDSKRDQQAVPAKLEQLLPPVVNILSPLEGTAISSSPVALTVSVHAGPDAPTTAVSVRVNGRLVSNPLPRGAKLEGDLQILVPMPSQDAEVQVFAENRNATSAPAVIRLAWKGPPPPAALLGEKPKLYLLAIGVSLYNNPEYRLGVAAKDAVDFANAMTAQKGLGYRDVEVRLLTDGKATGVSISGGLQWLRKSVTSKDFGMVMMAGHGLNDEKGQYYFAPADFDLNHTQVTGVPFSAIKSALVQLPGTAVFFVDTCHAFSEDISDLVNDLTSAENGVAVFSSSKGEQVAAERQEWGHGAFTLAVLEGLDGKADLRNDGHITVEGMDRYVTPRVQFLTGGTQTPVVVSAYGDLEIATISRDRTHH